MNNDASQYTRYTLRPEDVHFLLDHKTTAMFGESTINERNHDAQWAKFIKRNTKKGYVDEDGEVAKALKEAVKPVKYYTNEFILTNQFSDPEKIIARAAFYTASEASTFAKRTSDGFRREFELEYITDEKRRESVLCDEFSLGDFTFTDAPFSHLFDPKEAEEVHRLGQGSNPEELRRWARSKDVPFTDIVYALKVFEQTDRFVVMGTSEAGDDKACMITGSTALGVMVKSVYVRSLDRYKLISTAFDRLAKQGFWDYFTTY